MQDRVLELLAARHGHFRFESGHHGSLWLDLELLCVEPRRLQPLAAALAERLGPYGVEWVCGPLVEGAYVAQLVAVELDARFCYTQPAERPGHHELFPVDYRVPAALRPLLPDRRVAIVNDVINAGSAVRGTLADLRRCRARPVALGTLAVLGDAAAALARHEGVALETLAHLASDLWLPEECPLCAAGQPLDRGADR
jgi:orotate phosphoribosyltransferase